MSAGCHDFCVHMCKKKFPKTKYYIIVTYVSQLTSGTVCIFRFVCLIFHMRQIDSREFNGTESIRLCTKSLCVNCVNVSKHVDNASIFELKFIFWCS